MAQTKADSSCCKMKDGTGQQGTIKRTGAGFGGASASTQVQAGWLAGNQNR